MKRKRGTFCQENLDELNRTPIHANIACYINFCRDDEGFQERFETCKCEKSSLLDARAKSEWTRVLKSGSLVYCFCRDKIVGVVIPLVQTDLWLLLLDFY